MKQLTLKDILNVEDVKTKRVELPKWGGFVIIQQMTAKARDAYELSLLKTDESGKSQRDLENIRAKIVAACVLDPGGELMFKTPDHVKALGNKNSEVVDFLYSQCQEFNAISNEDIEELAGN